MRRLLLGVWMVCAQPLAAEAQRVEAPIEVAPAALVPGALDLRAIATVGSDYLVFYHSADTGIDEMTASRLASDGSSATDLPLRIHPFNAVACAASWCVGAWVETAALGPPQSDVFIQRFMPDGTLIDPSPVLVESIVDAAAAYVSIDHADGDVFGLGVAAQYATPTFPTYRTFDFRIVGLDAIEDPLRVSIHATADPLNVSCITGLCLLGWIELGSDHFVRISTLGGGELLDDPHITAIDVQAEDIVDVPDRGWAIFGYVSRRLARDGTFGPNLAVPPSVFHDCSSDGDCNLIDNGFGFGPNVFAQWYESGTWSRLYGASPLPSYFSLFACAATDDCAAIAAEGTTHPTFRYRVDPVDAFVVEPMPDFGRVHSDQRGPMQVVTSPTRTLVLYQDRPSRTEQRLLAVRMGPDGLPDGTDPVIVSTGPLRNDEWFTAAAIGDGYFLVRWNGFGDSELVRLDGTGAPISEPLSLPGLNRPMIFPDGDGALLVSGAVYQRLNAIGERLDPTPRRLFPTDEITGVVRLVPRADGWLALVGDAVGAIRTVRLDAAFGLLDPAPGALVRDAAVGPMLVGTAEGGVAIWIEGSDPYEIRASRLIDGESLDLGGRVLATTYHLFQFAAARIGSRIVVTWTGTDDPTQPTTGFASFWSSADLTPVGSRLDIGCGLECTEVALGGLPLVVGMEGPRGPGYVRDVSVALLVDDSLGAGCIMDSDCASGFCTSSVCCDARCDGACEQCGSGSCTVLAAGIECRMSGGPCDAPELCDGTSAVCGPEVIDVCDAGVPDAGAPDAGTHDAGSPDAGSPESAAGCACTAAATRTPGLGALPLVLLLALSWRRRKR